MSTPRPEERRLGLLQCPNAASRGWANASSEAQDDALDVLVDEPSLVQVAATVVDVDKRENEAVQIPDFCNIKAVDVTNGDLTDASENKDISVETTEELEAVLNDGTEVNSDDATLGQVEKNSHTDTFSYSVASVATDDAERPRKRPRANEEEHVDADANIAVELASNNGDVLMEGTSEIANTTDEVIARPLTEGTPTQAETITPTQPTPEDANANPLNVSLEYESVCSCNHCASQHSKDEQGADTGAKSKCVNEKGQLLTITYRCGNELQCIALGSISGTAKLEVMSDTLAAVDKDLALDVFGYRLSESNPNIMQINRPDWMNALPLTLICPASDGVNKTLKVRIKSLHDGSSEQSTEDSYYGAHPEESYKLNIHSSIRNDNRNIALNERRNGVIFISDPWRITADKIVNAVRSADAPLSTKNASVDEATTSSLLSNHNRVLVCGAKGVGKSTYLRYITNRMLSTTYQQVAVLDLDSGQPELSPPGLLTLSILSKPIVADPPMHMNCTGSGRIDNNKVSMAAENDDIVDHLVSSYFFGDITSKSDPDTYIHIANKLMNKYQELIASKEEYSSLPLVVNTDGWVKGLGYEILSAVVGICKAAHIVQILGNTKAKSFDMTSFHTTDGDNTMSGTTVHTIQSFDDFSNPLLEDGSKRCSLDSQSVGTGTLLATASDHRSHRICAYFLKGCDNMSRLRSGIAGDDTSIQFHKEKGLVDPSNVIGLTLASMLPYAVPFHAVKLYPPSGLLDSLTELGQMWGVRGDIASNDVLDSLSGAIVGLCYEQDASDSPSIVNCNAGCGVPVLPCAGLGIIRSIDTIRRIFYVLTPVHPELLPRVTSFVGGNIGLPLECVYRGIYSDSFPYMSFGQAASNPGLGWEVMKSRNHSGRKR